VRFEYLIGIRYLRARRRERFVSLIALISLIGVAIGTFALTVVLAVMSGFQEELRDRLLAFNPQITATFEQASAPSSEVEKAIARVPGVAAIAPFASSQVMVVSTTPEGVPAYVSGGTLRAVLAENNPVLTELKQTLTRGSLRALDDVLPVALSENGKRRVVKLPGIIVGNSLADDLGLSVGDPLIVISPASLGAGAIPRLRRFVIAGFFHSGMYEFDSSLMFVSLKNGEALLADDPQLERGLEIRADNLFAAPAIARQIARAVPGKVMVSDWTQTDAPLFSALKLEKFTYFLVLLLIVLVAAFNIIATLVMVVMERRKEIAILRAIGARASSISTIFLCEGIALGAGGTVLGVGFGWLFAFLLGRYHFIHLPPDLFMISAVPVRLYPANFIAVAAAAILLCIVGAIYPALRARALRPVEVIRYE
jgi:lipoprotein-releasing system permease protein